MREYKPFEQSLSKQFEAFKPEVSNDKIWDAIVDEIPTKKKDRSFLVYWMSGLATIAILIGGYFLIGNKGKAALATVEKTDNTEHKAISESEKPDYETKPLQKDEIDQTISQQKLNTTTQKIAEANTINKQNKKAEHNFKVSSSIVNNLKEQLSHFQQSKTEETIRAFGTTSSTNIRLQPAKKVKPYINNPTLQSAVTKQKNAIQAFASLDMSELQLDRLQNNRDALVIDYPAQHDLILKSKRLPLGHSIGAQVSYYIPTVTYASNGNTEPAYQAVREENEQALEALQGQLYYRMYFNKNWSLQFGLNYWSMQESVRYRNFTQQLTTIDTTIGIIHLPDGGQELITGEQEFNQKVYTQYVRYNRYQGYAIPVQLGYQTSLGKGLSAAWYIGYEKALGGSISGYEFNPDMSEYNIDTDTENRFKNHLGNYGLAGVRLEKHFGSHLSLSLSLDGKYGLDYITTINALLDKQYHFLGISLGSNYHF